MKYSATKGYYKLCLSTLVTVYFLILVGGIVRTTGSERGCPKCFGQWVPPTSSDQLPSDYKVQLAANRDKKNQKFATYLSAIGMEDTAGRISSDKSILEEADFNPLKTQIEYTNRLIGVIVGFLILTLFVRSIPLLKASPLFFWFSLATLLAVIFQGWFGSIVVSTNLTSWTKTIHIFLALVVVVMLILLLNKLAIEQTIRVPRQVKMLLLSCMILLLNQILLGTEVRGAVDRVVKLPEEREKWISLIWPDFNVHRSFSWIVLTVHALFIFKLKKTTGHNALSLSLVLLILLTVLSGSGMGYFSVPAFLQPIHLLLATATFGVQFLLFMRFNSNRIIVLAN